MIVPLIPKKTSIQKNHKFQYQKSYFQKNKTQLNSARKFCRKQIQLAEENPTWRDLVAYFGFLEYKINVIYSSGVSSEDDANVKVKQEFNLADIPGASKETIQVKDDVCLEEQSPTNITDTPQNKVTRLNNDSSLVD